MASKRVVIGVFIVIAIVILISIGFTFLGGRKEEMTIVLGPIELPKAPYWDESKRSIYFVDVYQSEVHRFDPVTKEHKIAKVGSEPLAFIIPIKNSADNFIISYGPFLAKLKWDGNSNKTDLRILRSIDQNVYRANEGKVSPSGSLFIGMHSPILQNSSVQMNAANLYAFYKDGTIKTILKNVTISNGMGWNKDGDKFYYIDSLAYTVESFSYDVKTDTLSNRTMIMNFQKEGIPGLPDGMAVDNEDKLWVTSFNGYQVLQIDPESHQVLGTVNVDALKVTSALFAGPQLDTFYITTGNYSMSQTDMNKYPHSGYIYEISNFRSSGRPGVPFEINPNL